MRRFITYGRKSNHGIIVIVIVIIVAIYGVFQSKGSTPPKTTVHSEYYSTFEFDVAERLIEHSSLERDNLAPYIPGLSFGPSLRPKAAVLFPLSARSSPSPSTCA